MKFKIAWLYYDLLELYGDSGNIKIIESILKSNNIDYQVDKLTIADEFDIEDHDLIFLGGGSDYAQNILYKHLLSKKDKLEKVLENKGFILTICGGYQMFGKYYKDSQGNIIEGLGIFDFYTVPGDNRCTGNVVAECTLNGETFKLVGFENHNGQTLGVDKPLAKVLKGNGNEYKSMYEGYMNENFIGSYIHGPLLPKNPEIAKYIIEYVFKNKYNEDKKIHLNHSDFYKQAKELIIKRELKC